MASMETPILRVGALIHGYAGGMFGRDSYKCRRIEALGVDWVMTRRLDDGEPEAATNRHIDAVLQEYLLPWIDSYEPEKGCLGGCGD